MVSAPKKYFRESKSQFRPQKIIFGNRNHGFGANKLFSGVEITVSAPKSRFREWKSRLRRQKLIIGSGNYGFGANKSFTLWGEVWSGGPVWDSNTAQIGPEPAAAVDTLLLSSLRRRVDLSCDRDRPPPSAIDLEPRYLTKPMVRMDPSCDRYRPPPSAIDLEPQNLTKPMVLALPYCGWI